MNIVEEQAPYRRGRALAILAQSNDTGCSVPLLRGMVRDFGYKVDSDTFVIDAAWLTRHGLADRREVGGVVFLRITPRGHDVVSGDLDLPGITIAREG